MHTCERQFEHVRKGERHRVHVKEYMHMWSDGSQNKHISRKEKKEEEEEEEVEGGGGCLGDDRPHERSVCLGSGMKLKVKKKRRKKNSAANSERNFL